MDIVKQRAAVVPIDAIRPSPDNVNVGALDTITASVQANGFFGSVLVQESTGMIIAGEHRWRAAKALGAQEIPVLFLAVDDDRARRIRLADNRTARLGHDDPERLSALLQELATTPQGLQGTGFDDAALDSLLADLGAHHQPELWGDPDAVPEVPAEPITQRGDLWRCGDHLVLCEDATVLADVERVMEGAQANMVWTDPPYGVSYVGGNQDPRSYQYRRGRAMANDDLGEEAQTALLRGAFAAAYAVCRPGAAWYVAAPAGPLHLLFGSVLAELEVVHQTLVWVKQHFVFGRSDYHYRHEPIFYGWKPGAARHFTEDRAQDSVWEIDRPMNSDDHPTMKPVELVARAIRNSSRRGDLVLDPFAGSGTVMVACEQEGRRARLIEIDPHYVDVAVRRWETLTGQQAVREPAASADQACVAAAT